MNQGDIHESPIPVGSIFVLWRGIENKENDRNGITHFANSPSLYKILPFWFAASAISTFEAVYDFLLQRESNKERRAHNENCTHI